MGCSAETTPFAVEAWVWRSTRDELSRQSCEDLTRPSLISQDGLGTCSSSYRRTLCGYTGHGGIPPERFGTAKPLADCEQL
jgi:hypothetical protein